MVQSVKFIRSEGLVIDADGESRTVQTPALAALSTVQSSRSGRKDVLAVGPNRIGIAYTREGLDHPLSILNQPGVGVFVNDSETVRHWIVERTSDGFVASEINRRQRETPRRVSQLPASDGNAPIAHLFRGLTDGCALDVIVTVEVPGLDVASLDLRRSWVVDGIESLLPGAEGPAKPMSVVGDVEFMG